MKLRTYLNFGGNCAEALEYYKQHIGAQVMFLMTMGQGPGGEALPADQKDKVMHASFSIAGIVLMASDAPLERYQPTRSSYLAITVDNADDARRIYAALSNGGEIAMPLQETFFAHHYAIVRDKFGVLWMVIHEKPMR